MIPRISPFKKSLLLKKKSECWRKKVAECFLSETHVSFVFTLIDVIEGIVFSVFHHVLQFPYHRLLFLMSDISANALKS